MQRGQVKKIHLNDASELGSLKCQIYLLVSPIYLKSSVKRAQRRSLFHIKFIVKLNEEKGQEHLLSFLQL